MRNLTRTTPHDDAIEADTLAAVRDGAEPDCVELLEPLGIILRAFGLNPSPASIWRWVQKGKNGVKLRVVRTDRLLAKRSWVAEFVEGISENRPEAPPVATPRQIEARHRRALTALEKP
jgi:hypothetical protein